MNAILKKDVRSLTPSFAATIGITILSALVFSGQHGPEFIFICYGLGAALMAASIFGNEFSSRTMSQLLAQPIPRERIWRNKMTVLGAQLAITYPVLIAACAYRLEVRPAYLMNPLICLMALALALLPLILFCSAPLVTLIAKNTLGAIAFTIVTPWIIVMIIVLIDAFVSWLLGRPETFGDAFSKAHPNLTWGGIAVCALLYCAITYRLGFRVFMDYQAIDTQSQEIALPASIAKPFTRLLAGIAPRVNHPIASLVWKELRLHRVAFILAGVAVCIEILAVVAGAIHRSEEVNVALMLPLFLCLFVMPIIIGLATVADERNAGVLEWQLMQPVSRGRQWMIKLLTAFSVCLALGVLLPGALFWLSHSVLGYWPKADFGPSGLQEVAALFMTYLLGFSGILLGSAISQNIGKAAATGLGLLILFGLAYALGDYWADSCLRIFRQSGSERTLLAKIVDWVKSTQMSHDQFVRDAWNTIFFIGSICALAVIFMLQWISFQNFRAVGVSPRRTWTQIFGIACFVLISVFIVQFLNPVMMNDLALIAEPILKAP